MRLGEGEEQRCREVRQAEVAPVQRRLLPEDPRPDHHPGELYFLKFCRTLGF